MPMKTLNSREEYRTLHMSEDMRRHRQKAKDWTDDAIYISVKRALHYQATPGNVPGTYFSGMYVDELAALLAGAILYLDSLNGSNPRIPEAEPMERERKIDLDL